MEKQFIQHLVYTKKSAEPRTLCKTASPKLKQRVKFMSKSKLAKFVDNSTIIVYGPCFYFKQIKKPPKTSCPCLSFVSTVINCQLLAVLHVLRQNKLFLIYCEHDLP